MSVRDIKDFFANILYPQKCAFCEDISDNRTVLCESCKDSVLKIIDNSKFDFSHEKYSFANKIVAVFEYNKVTSKAILRLKNVGDRDIVEFFGELLCKEFYKNFEINEIDLMIPVPMHKLKRKLKGFNHSDCIAEYVSEKTDIPVIKNALIKAKNNKTQHFLSEQERKENILGVYSLKTNKDIKHKNILLVDDVITTGSTLSECARVLYENGAKSVSALVIGATIEKTI